MNLGVWVVLLVNIFEELVIRESGGFKFLFINWLFKYWLFYLLIYINFYVYEDVNELVIC